MTYTPNIDRPFRAWSRVFTDGTNYVWGEVTDTVPGYTHDDADWPEGIVFYTAQSGGWWETGVGEIRAVVAEPDISKRLRVHGVIATGGAGLEDTTSPDGAVDIALCQSSAYPQRRWWAIYGDGSDGDVTINGAVTLVRPMFYHNLTIGTAGAVTTGGWAVYVSGKFTLPDSRSTAAPVFEVTAGSLGDSTASTLGFNGDGGIHFSAPGIPPTAGFDSSQGPTYRVGGAGGAGGGGGSVVPSFDFWNMGAGGGNSATTLELRNISVLPPMELLIGGASGGGGGGGGAESAGMSFGGGGGQGGSGGGVIYLNACVIDGGTAAPGTLLLARANGADGDTGAINSPGAGQGGGGGGGGGGALIIVSDFINRLPWIAELNGGAPGAGGDVTAVGGQGGAVYTITRQP